MDSLETLCTRQDLAKTLAISPKDLELFGIMPSAVLKDGFSLTYLYRLHDAITLYRLNYKD
jgi:hypothetical protein